MNKKAQAGPLAMIILVIVFVIVWFIFLAKFVNEVGANMIETNHLTGVEAFFYANLNLVIFIGLVIGTMAWFYFAGG